VTPAPEFSAEQIFALRKPMGLSQPVFALALNVSPETEKAWEQGKFAPGGSVKRLLQNCEPAAGHASRRHRACELGASREAAKRAFEAPKKLGRFYPTEGGGLFTVMMRRCVTPASRSGLPAERKHHVNRQSLIARWNRT
jgi:transcriptional regulator with XRE-family HTH domain